MEISDRDVDEFIADLNDDVRDDIATLDTIIRNVFSGLPRVLFEGKMWGGTDQEIIGYGRYQYGKDFSEWFVVGLAVQKNHLSIYINSVEDGQYLSEKYGKDLGKVKVGKAAIALDSADDIDLEALESLMRRSREIYDAG